MVVGVCVALLATLGTSSAALQLQGQNLVFGADVDPTTTSLTFSHSCGQLSDRCRLIVLPAGERPSLSVGSARLGDLVDVYGEDSCSPNDLFVVATETKGKQRGAAYSACTIVNSASGISNHTVLAKGNCRPAATRAVYSLNAGWKFDLEYSQGDQCANGGRFPTNRSRRVR